MARLPASLQLSKFAATRLEHAKQISCCEQVVGSDFSFNTVQSGGGGALLMGPSDLAGVDTASTTFSNNNAACTPFDLSHSCFASFAPDFLVVFYVF